MGQKHFISVLGTSFYSDFKCTYESEPGEKIYQYCQQAILECCIKTNIEKITIFGTKDSIDKNWKNYDYKDKDVKNIKNKDIIRPECKNAGDEKKGLEKILEAHYKGKFVEQIIPEGKNQDELWDIFHNIYDSISDEDELYIDITNGLRSIPLQMMTVLQYAKMLKKVTVKGIYYGAFELGKRNPELSEEEYIEFPIFDLKMFNTILDWASAAQAFIKNGTGTLLDDLCKQSMENEKAELKECVAGLAALTNTLETSRGKVFHSRNTDEEFKRSIHYAYEKFKSNYNSINNDNSFENRELRPLKELMETIDKDTSFFHIDNIKELVDLKEEGKRLEIAFAEKYNKNPNLAVGLAAIKWAIDKKLPQQGYTALEETIKTLVCVTYGLNETLNFDRQTIVANIVKKISDNLKQQRQKAKKGIYYQWIPSRMIKIDKKKSEMLMQNIKDYLWNVVANNVEIDDEIIKQVIVNVKNNLILSEYRQKLEANECSLAEYQKISDMKMEQINFTQPLYQQIKELIYDKLKSVYNIIETLTPEFVEFAKGDSDQNSGLSNIRNSINHFGFLNTYPKKCNEKCNRNCNYYYEPLPYTYEELNDQLKEKYDELIQFVIEGIDTFQNQESR